MPHRPKGTPAPPPDTAKRVSVSVPLLPEETVMLDDLRQLLDLPERPAGHTTTAMAGRRGTLRAALIIAYKSAKAHPVAAAMALGLTKREGLARAKERKRAAPAPTQEPFFTLDGASAPRKGD